MGKQASEQLTLGNYPKNVTKLAAEILRDRKQGVPRYNTARRMLRLAPVTSFDELSDNAYDVATLRTLYATVEDIDFVVGCLVDTKLRPSGYTFSEVDGRIMLLTVARLVKSDVFLQEKYDTLSYTQGGLAYVNDISFADILQRHYGDIVPEFSAQGNSVFGVWT
jgi:hypothetical protein